LWLLSEDLGHFKSKLFISNNVPPLLFENGLGVNSQVSVFLNDNFGERNGGVPDIVFVVFEVCFISALTFEVDIEPLGEFTSQNDQVVHPVEVQRSENNNGDFVISKTMSC
jgi:hypothetical protein